LRAGDNLATNPIVLRARGFLRQCVERVFERDVITNELLGFVISCATSSAAHKGDYMINYGTALLASPARVDRLLELAVKVGYFEQPEQIGGEDVWKLIDDPEFLHMISRDVRDWEAQRKADVANPALTVPVRVRDGDGCRYCGKVVNWRDRKSVRGATYDHRPPGQPATVDTLVVCCFGCNRLRGNAEDADERFPLLPAAAEPYYSLDTIKAFQDHPGLVPRHIQIKLHLTPAASSAGRATTDERSVPASGRAPRSATPQPAGQRTSADTTSGAPVGGTRSADPADPGCARSGFAGSGRDGTGPGLSTGMDRSAGTRRRRGNRGRGNTKPR
jgi:hypothetical protein